MINSMNDHTEEVIDKFERHAKLSLLPQRKSDNLRLLSNKENKENSNEDNENDGKSSKLSKLLLKNKRNLMKK